MNTILFYVAIFIILLFFQMIIFLLSSIVVDFIFEPDMNKIVNIIILISMLICMCMDMGMDIDNRRMIFCILVLIFDIYNITNEIKEYFKKREKEKEQNEKR